jgi:hypothetical protein
VLLKIIGKQYGLTQNGMNYALYEMSRARRV